MANVLEFMEHNRDVAAKVADALRSVPDDHMIVGLAVTQSMVDRYIMGSGAPLRPARGQFSLVVNTRGFDGTANTETEWSMGREGLRRVATHTSYGRE